MTHTAETTVDDEYDVGHAGDESHRPDTVEFPMDRSDADDDAPQTELDPFDVDSAVDTPEMIPPRIVVFGTHGIGKTSLARWFPNSITLFTENGKGALPIRSFPIVATEFQQIISAISSLLRNPKDRQSFFVDSLDKLEGIVWAETCARANPPVDNIEDFGYGKGYARAGEVWSELLRGFDALRDAGFIVVLLAHHDVVKFEPPDADKYDRYDLKLHKIARALVHEWADVVAFAYEKVYTTTKTEGTGKSAKTKTKGGGSGGRFLALERRSTWEAKNRYSLPAEISLVNDRSTADELLGRIAESFAS